MLWVSGHAIASKLPDGRLRTHCQRTIKANKKGAMGGTFERPFGDKTCEICDKRVR